MISGSLVFLTPEGGFAALAVLVPLAVLATAAVRVAQARSLLGLARPRHRQDRLAALAVIATSGLLSVAAAQPAVATQTRQLTRTDAQVLFVFDVSGSMQASTGPTGPTRLARARRFANVLRASIPQVPSGVATLTDQLLPVLLPVADQAAFSSALERSVAIEQPPPFEDTVVATDFGALSQAAQYGYFAPHVVKRVVVVLTDGESAPFAAGAVASAYSRRPSTSLIEVQFWGSSERIYDGPDGHADPGYRPSPLGRVMLDGLATATGGRVFDESDLGGATAALRSDLGKGPTVEAAEATRNDPLTPYLALSGLIPVALLLWRRII
jgi:hypothetical protein